MVKMINLPTVLVLLLVTSTCQPRSMEAATEIQEPFSVDDYFNLKWFVELALSSNGERVAYVTNQQSLEKNNAIRTVYVSTTMNLVEPLIIEEIQEATSLQWIPGTQKLAYISSKGGVPQVYSLDIGTREQKQHTYGHNPVLKFQFSPDGRSLAWLTRDRSTTPLIFNEYQSSALYERLFNGEEGVVIDTEITSFSHFVNPKYANLTTRSYRSFFVNSIRGRVSEIAIPGQVKNFNWSSDSSKISVVFTDNEIPERALYDRYTSVGAVDLDTSTFRRIATADAPSPGSPAIYYDGGEWVPGKNEIFLFKHKRVPELSLQRTKWALIDLSDNLNGDTAPDLWYDIEIYRLDKKPNFFPIDNGEVFTNKTVSAKRFLYKIGDRRETRASFLAGIDGDVSHFQFSADFKNAVFINDSMSRPPELYVWRKKTESVQRITDLNRSLANKRLPTSREVFWKSADNVEIQGWLIEPPGPKEGPRPMVTFVPGGPSLAFTNEFAFYFKSHFGGVWPYPFEVYALNGMAVFIPNYRGKKTFGLEFSDPSAYDAEPVDDIIAGVTHLIEQGIADPTRLAISGQSHGAWLASLVMVRDRRYVAGSFAEGAMNHFVVYATNPGRINRKSDLMHDTNPYSNPERYVEISPDFHYKGLRTAVLFEAGARSNAVRMMGSPKAAQRAGMPTEFIVYPQTSHNIHVPSLQRESAERNLDWFNFWLLRREDSDADKAEQYERWRAMRLPD